MTDSKSLSRTPLYDLHVELGGKMVGFAGYQMPVQFPEGIIREHLHTRESSGLFDVSHMGQVIVRGEYAAQGLERLLPVDLEALPAGNQTYALFTQEDGGILDDLIVTRWGPDEFFLVVNAACKEQDIAHLRSNLGEQIEVVPLPDRALMALQGPAAAGIISAYDPELGKLLFMQGKHTELDGAACYVTRSGYTGEDGFEISVPADRAASLAARLLESDQVRPVGLGARDSLRLEAGLCLYGHDISTETTPVEASLLWSIARSRRPGGQKEGGFAGWERIFEQIGSGVSRKRVGLLPVGRTPVREGASLVDSGGNEVGTVTSGGFGPSLGAPVALGYVTWENSAPGTRLQALVRNKEVPVEVSKTPFVPHNYYRG